VADCSQALPLIGGLSAGALLADKGYDTDEVVSHALGRGMEPVIPPKRNRVARRAYDKHTYKVRHLVENAFRKLKEWRGIATRYAKRSLSFLACVQIRCVMLWLQIS
jgi:transposase